MFKNLEPKITRIKILNFKGGKETVGDKGKVYLK